jgi:hypothetical protein
MYTCGDLLTRKNPPDNSVRLTETKCNNAEHGQTCRYNCLGTINSNARLDGQSVTLYDYSPDISGNAMNYSEYTCDIPVKIILRFHGFVLTQEPRVILSDDTTKFKLITYTEQGKVLSNENMVSGLAAITIACSNGGSLNSNPVETFSSFFYDIRFTPDFQVVVPTGYMGIIECLTPNNNDFLTIATRIESGGDSERYAGELNYYTMYDISRQILEKGETLESFRLSDIVPSLKKKFPGRSINLHLMTCLSVEGSIEQIPSDDLGIQTYNWNENRSQTCDILPTCTYNSGRGVDKSNCSDGHPKGISYNAGSPVDAEPSACKLTCLQDYNPIQPPNTLDNGKCHTYRTFRGELMSEYLNFDDGTLHRVDINCTRDSHCSAEMSSNID